MKDRRRLWAMVAILAVLGGGYMVARPQMPVEFLDGAPDVSFVTSGQRPFIDFRAPILGHIRIPNTDLIGQTDTQPDIIFGYLDWSRESQDGPVSGARAVSARPQRMRKERGPPYLRSLTQRTPSKTSSNSYGEPPPIGSGFP